MLITPKDPLDQFEEGWAPPAGTGTATMDFPPVAEAVPAARNSLGAASPPAMDFSLSDFEAGWTPPKDSGSQQQEPWWQVTPQPIFRSDTPSPQMTPESSPTFTTAEPVRPFAMPENDNAGWWGITQWE